MVIPKGKICCGALWAPLTCTGKGIHGKTLDFILFRRSDCFFDSWPWFQGNLKGFYGYYKGQAAGKGKFKKGQDAPFKGPGPEGRPGGGPGGPGADPGAGGCGSAVPAN
jgi:hypothetical protein